MAWPLTPLTTYVASSTPAIKASDLNSIQSAINSLYSGALSIKSLYVDGVGAAASPIGAGNAFVSGTIVSSTATSKDLWIPGSYWDVMGGTWTHNNTQSSVVCSSGPGKLRYGLLLPYLPPSGGQYTLISVGVAVDKASTSTMTLEIFHTIPNFGGADTIPASTTNSSSGIQAISITGLSLACTTTSYYWLVLDGAVTSDAVAEISITYSNPVF